MIEVETAEAIMELVKTIRGSQSDFSMTGAHAPLDLHITVGFTEETLEVLNRIAEALENH